MCHACACCRRRTCFEPGNLTLWGQLTPQLWQRVTQQPSWQANRTKITLKGSLHTGICHMWLGFVLTNTNTHILWIYGLLTASSPSTQFVADAGSVFLDKCSSRSVGVAVSHYILHSATEPFPRAFRCDRNTNECIACVQPSITCSRCGFTAKSSNL